jgi:hypothetical protein
LAPPLTVRSLPLQRQQRHLATSATTLTTRLRGTAHRHHRCFLLTRPNSR